MGLAYVLQPEIGIERVNGLVYHCGNVSENKKRGVTVKRILAISLVLVVIYS